MITPNAYSESVGQQVLRADKDACYRQGVEEKKRLLAELRGGDPALAALEGKESAGGDASRTVAIGDAHRGSTRGLIGSDRVAGTAGVAAGEFLLSAWDLDPYDEEYLANYLGTFTATKRLAYICLRAKGYRVEDHEEDGSGAASLVLNPARVVLREENGTEVVFYGSSP